MDIRGNQMSKNLDKLISLAERLNNKYSNDMSEDMPESAPVPFSVMETPANKARWALTEAFNKYESYFENYIQNDAKLAKHIDNALEALNNLYSYIESNKYE